VPETFFVFQHIDVFEGYLAAGEILTGSRSIRSKIFAKNQDRIRGHGVTLLVLKNYLAHDR